MSELTLSPELLQISAEVQDALKNKKPVIGKKTGYCAGIDHNFSRNAIPTNNNFSRNAIPTKCPNRN